MLKVVFLINQFHPIIGGAERQAEILARKLTEKGVDVTIVTGWWDRSIPKDEVIDRVKVHRCFIPWIKINNTKKGGSFFSSISYFFYLLFHRNEYDIIQCFQVYNEAFVALIIGKLFGKIVIAMSSSGGLTPDLEIIEDFWAGKFKKRYIINHLKHFVALSEDCGRGFIEEGISSSNINYITNGVDINVEWKKNHSSKVSKIITVARLTKIRGIDWKGIDILISSMRKIILEFPHIVLDIIGDGPEKKTYIRSIESLRLNNNIRLLGEKREVEPYLQNADIFVMASRTEGMSNALLEAMSYGLPCVTTSVGGNREIINHGENGLLVEPEDPVGLGEAIIELIRNQSLREKIGRGARRTVVEGYSIDTIAEKYLEFYKRLYIEKDEYKTRTRKVLSQKYLKERRSRF